MRIAISYGWERLEVEAPDQAVVEARRQPVAASVSDVSAAVRAALDAPVDFPPLRRALTPDDHVAIVVDEELPHLPQLLLPVLEHIAEAHVVPQAITLVCPPSTTGQPWLEDLPEAFEDVHLEIHDPRDRTHLAYLATTRRGRRVYLNRTVVDADQAVLLTGRRYDLVLGYSGAEGALFPALGDEATRQEAAAQLTLKAPGKSPSHWRQEAVEVAWLLGAPFLVQVIEGAGSDIQHVIAGPEDSSALGQRLLDARWHVEVERPADLVVAGISGDPARQTIAEMARALACAARVVKPAGRIVLLTAADPPLGKEIEPLLQSETPEAALHLLKEQAAADTESALLWASAARQATVYLLSKLPAGTAEEMFTVPMDHAGQVQRLLQSAESCLFLPDANKTMATVRK